METKYTIDHSYYLEDAQPECPFCGVPMELDRIKHFCCNNAECPFNTTEVVRDVFEALKEQGRDRRTAADIAGKYSVEQDEELDPVTLERFAVTDETSANWVLKKIAFYEARLAAAQTMIDNELAAITARGEQITGPLARQVDFFRTVFGEQVRTWASEQVAGQKSKSIKLLHGTAGFRKNPDRVNVINESEAIFIAERLNLTDMVRVRKEISRTAAKAVLQTPEGAALKGVVEIEPGEEVFYLKAEMPGGAR